jgi:hypothetical protein
MDPDDQIAAVAKIPEGQHLSRDVSEEVTVVTPAWTLDLEVAAFMTNTQCLGDFL